MELEEAYQYIRKANVIIIYGRFGDAAVSLPNGYIGIDPNFECARVIMHELGHIETCEFYTRCDKPCKVHRAETQADRWAFIRMCPVVAVKRMAQEHGGYVADWQIAEAFTVSLEDARIILDYIERGIIR